MSYFARGDDDLPNNLLGRVVNIKNRFHRFGNNLQQKFDNPMQAYDQHRYREAREQAQKQIYSYYNKTPLNMYQPQGNQNLYLFHDEQLKREQRGKEIAKQYYKNRRDGGKKKDPTSYDFSDDQENYIFPDPFIRYKIIPAEKQRMALDVTSINSKEDHLQRGKMIVWDYHGGSNQHFYLKKIGNDDKTIFCQIINASTGFRLEAPKQSTNQLEQQLCMTPILNGRLKQSQIWRLQTVAQDLFVIHSCYGTVIDVRYGWIRNGTSVIHFEEKKNQQGRNQKWRIWPC